MQANNFFDPARMGFYLRKYITENTRFYLLGMLAIFLLMTVIPALTMLRSSNFEKLSSMAPMYYVGLFLGGLLLTSRAFRELGSKERAVDFLLLPASMFEKFLTIFLISTLGFMLAYHLSFYATFRVLDAVAYSVRGKHIETDFNFLDERSGVRYLYHAYFLTQAAVFAGAAWFRKYSLVKTIFCCFALAFLIYAINFVLVFGAFVGTDVSAKFNVPFIMVMELGKTADGGVYTSNLFFIPKGLQEFYFFGFKYLITPVLWVIAYFRLKDTEI